MMSRFRLLSTALLKLTVVLCMSVPNTTNASELSEFNALVADALDHYRAARFYPEQLVVVIIVVRLTDCA
ncbi:MAG: hypothetical protein ACE5NW_06420 [Acidiferrobacterales bacterium]